MIDITKEYKTVGGKRVINLQYVPLNCLGNKVTYPIKGTVVLCEKPWKTEYRVWTEDGEYDCVWHNHPKRNLIRA